MEEKKRFGPFVIYLILFFSVWTAWAYLLYPRMESLGNSTLAYAGVNITLRLLIWVLPVFLYLRYVDRASPVEYLKLRRHWKRGLLIGLAVSALNFLGTMLRFGPPHLSAQYLTWNSILGTSLLIGFVEEIPFRGFILQKFQERFGFWIANVVSSLLFVGIHLPGWISLRLLNASSVVSIFIFGVIMAIILKYSKSLWACIVAHSLNDFISFVLFHI
jgi:membrane protease YdiL (CAAX protease family)